MDFLTGGSFVNAIVPLLNWRGPRKQWWLCRCTGRGGAEGERVRWGVEGAALILSPPSAGGWSLTGDSEAGWPREVGSSRRAWLLAKFPPGPLGPGQALQLVMPVTFRK